MGKRDRFSFHPLIDSERSDFRARDCEGGSQGTLDGGLRDYRSLSLAAR